MNASLRVTRAVSDLKPSIESASVQRHLPLKQSAPLHAAHVRQIPTQPTEEPIAQIHLSSELRILTCGSVDDGKSTLIGRLLWDASDLFDDQRETLRRSDRRVLDGKHLDYSLLLDGLLAEREQGITIDIAWRYFDNANRRFVIIDSPGHEQYTRNMASGASHADVAVMLIDARHGIKQQTRRHAALLHLFGVGHVVLAVNKMDLADWSEARFAEIEAAFQDITGSFGFDSARAIPVSAVTGDNVARTSDNTPWYRGPSLLAALQAITPSATKTNDALRFPVQSILRDGQDFRGLAGTVSSGHVSVGEPVHDILSGRSAKVTRIATMDGDLASAIAGQAVALVLDTDLDISRGAVLASAGSAPVLARKLEARLIWLADQPFDPDTGYTLRTSTDSVPVARLQIDGHLDLASMAQRDAFALGANDIGFVTIGLNRPVALDRFADHRATGSFLVLDAITGATVAAGVVTSAHIDTRHTKAPLGFTLTRAMLETGLCKDLVGSADAEFELRRRATEVAKLFERAGVPVALDV
jgi:bifunctional enzyme CysN/CysC